MLVCVGPSDDKTQEVAAELARENAAVEVLDNPAGGIADALNLGLTAARAEILVRVDARCRLPEHYVATALASMAATGAANIGAVQVPTGHTPMQRAIAGAMTHTLGSGGAAYRVGGTLRQAETAFLGVFRTDALRSVGGWDVDFARNEDAELNQRLITAGHEVWLDPELRVEYEPRSSLRALARQYFDYGWWRRRTAARHRTMQLRQLAAPVVVIALSGAFVLGATVSPVFLIVPASYAMVLVGGAATADGPLRASERVRVAGALATMHLAWGSGFLASLIRGPLRVPPYTSRP